MATGIVWTVMPRGRRVEHGHSLEVTVAVGFVDHAGGEQVAGQPPVARPDPEELACLLRDWPGTVATLLEGFDFVLGVEDELPATSTEECGPCPVPAKPPEDDRRYLPIRVDRPAQGVAAATARSGPSRVTTACRDLPLDTSLWQRLFRHTLPFQANCKAGTPREIPLAELPDPATRFTSYPTAALARTVAQHAGRIGSGWLDPRTLEACVPFAV